MASFAAAATAPTARRIHGYATTAPYSVGVEEELQLVDLETFELVPAVEGVMARIAEDDSARIKHELVQSVCEIATSPCAGLPAAAEELAELRERVARCAREAGAGIASAGTSPTSRWQDQQVTDKQRYRDIIANLQWVARRELIFGLHVHVGVDSADKCMYVFNRIREHLPPLLALSASSPFWQGQPTGLQSSRIKVFDAFPRSGMPLAMPGGWDEWERLLARGRETGRIANHTFVWWDVRPHHEFGTIEIRICDAQSRLSDTLALTALIQAMVAWLGDEFDRGVPLGELPPQLLIEENRWSAARFGLDGEMVDLADDEVLPTRHVVARLLDRTEPFARLLGATEQFDGVARMLDRTAASRQLDAWHDAGQDITAVGRHVMDETAGS